MIYRYVEYDELEQMVKKQKKKIFVRIYTFFFTIISRLSLFPFLVSSYSLPPTLFRQTY